MSSRIHFIGGIHGVGKSTICREICVATNITYLSASDLLNWKEIKANPLDKKVDDISMTQMRLVDALEKTILPDTNYLLDGHYCLFNSDGEVTPIRQDVFIQISPCSLGVIVGDTRTISERLEKRDGKKYDQALLRKMQDAELNHAKIISSTLRLDFSIGSEDDVSKIISQVTRRVNHL